MHCIPLENFVPALAGKNTRLQLYKPVEKRSSNHRLIGVSIRFFHALRGMFYEIVSERISIQEPIPLGSQTSGSGFYFFTRHFLWHREYLLLCASHSAIDTI